MEDLDSEVYPVWAAPGVAGWQLDGPRYPAGATSRRSAERWARFGDRDLGRFYRDYLAFDARKEFEARLGRLPKGGPGEAAERTALVAARGLVLGEGPEALAAVAAPAAFAGRPLAVVAASLAVIQSAAPERYQRLIGGAGPTPLAPGPERDAGVPRTALATELRIRDAATAGGAAGAPRWPEPGWAGWTTPTGAPWGFGQIKPVRSGAPRALRELPLNWTTRVLVFDLP
jgi:hypothetical protein